MAKSKKVQMPAGIRNKLMAAIAMLLVSSIMMVSSTYAWFTLSTAPEVTGITTSVGANGNLEMALLTTETYGDLTEIDSYVRSSVANTGDVTKSNITWGNLVDLSHASYGLNLIALNPAAPNLDAETNTIGVTSLLQTAEYGADGRVTKLDANTVSGIYNSTTGKWVIKETLSDSNVATQTHGVRAIGVDSNMTTAQIVMAAAQAAVASGKTGAANGVSAAVNAHKDTFVKLLNKTDTAYSPDQLAALKAVAEGVQTSLNSIVKTYSNAVLALLASDANVAEDVLVKMRTDLSNNTKAANVATLLKDVTLGTEASSVLSSYTARLSTLATAQDNVSKIIDLFTVTDGIVGTTSNDVKNDILVPLIGGSDTVYAVGADNVAVELNVDSLGSFEAIYVAGGLFVTVAEDAGIYRLTTYLGYPVYSAVVTPAKSTSKDADGNDVTTTTVSITKSGNLADVATAVAGLSAANASNAEQTIADFYGYIIDFAFRTNAAGSYLQLQTEAVNRVYSDGGTATMGAGSTVTFNYSDSNGDAALTAQQVDALLGAVKMIFLDPVEGKVYATAKLNNIQIAETGNTATAEVILETTYVVASGDEDVSTAIVALDQNEATKVSVMVYLDGTAVDNADVSNGSSSGILNLNLQFSSSAELVPMDNSALKNLTSYTISFNANGGTGTMADVKGSGTYALPTTTTFTNEGYTFKGWSETAGGTQITTVTKGTTVYAIWEVATTTTPDTTYTVTYVSGDTNVEAPTDSNSYEANATVTLAGALTRTGYTFAGWNDGTTDYAAGATYTITGNTTMTAVWTADTYTVTINSAQQDTRATYGQEYTFTATATPTVKVNGTSVSANDNKNGTYTIAGTDVTGDIVIEFTT